MIDIHSHILFGVDDGPSSMEGSVTMVRDALKAGYNHIVCTSHYYPGICENEDYDKNFKLLQEKIVKENLSVKIYKGNEAVVHPLTLNRIKNINTINGTSYILIELDPGTGYKTCRKFMQKLINMGYIPILAHIERYTNFDLKEFMGLYNIGIVFQMNIREIECMSAVISYIFENGYLQVVATDNHRIDKRNYNVEKYIRLLREKAGEEYFNLLTEINPGKILKGERLYMKKWGTEDKGNPISGFFKRIKEYMF